MEKKMMMPASYNVMNEEEMTYTTGAGPIASAVTTAALLAFDAWGIYNYYKGMVATRNYIKANKGKDTAALIDGGLNTYVNYMQASVPNAVKGVFAGLASVSLFPITALCIVTA